MQNLQLNEVCNTFFYFSSMYKELYNKLVAIETLCCRTYKMGRDCQGGVMKNTTGSFNLLAELKELY
jgi:hypothetical protein